MGDAQTCFFCRKVLKSPESPGFGVSSLHVSLHVNLVIIKIKSKQNETLLFKITSFTILAARNPIVHSFAGYIPKLIHQANKTNLSCLNLTSLYNNVPMCGKRDIVLLSNPVVHPIFMQRSMFTMFAA